MDMDRVRVLGTGATSGRDVDETCKDRNMIGSSLRLCVERLRLVQVVVEEEEEEEGMVRSGPGG